MEIRNLMVGDWVICNHYQDKPFTKQFGVADFAKGDYEFCEPIPLTEEILVKNGYKPTQGIDFYWLDDKKHCCIKNYDGKRLFCYKRGINDVWLIIKYVHQLQHLLRLCGIDKKLIID